MLVLSRKKNESIVINNDITIVVVEIRGDKVRLGVEAPKEVPVHRREVYDSIRRSEAPRASRRRRGTIRVRGDAHAQSNRPAKPTSTSSLPAERLEFQRFASPHRRLPACAFARCSIAFPQTARQRVLAWRQPLDESTVSPIIHRSCRIPDGRLTVRSRYVRWPRRLARSRTPAFHADNTGSNPVGVTFLIRRVTQLDRRPSPVGAGAPSAACRDGRCGTALRRGPGGLVRRARRARRRAALSRERAARQATCRASGMLAVAEHYRALRRRQPAECPEPRTGRGAATRVRRSRLAAAGLLGQSQLAPVAGRHAGRNGRRRRAPRPGLLHFGLQLLFVLPAVPGKHREARAAGRADGARRSTSCGRFSTIPASSGR